MDNGVAVEDTRIVTMGASGDPSAARLAALKDRKKVIEESLEKHNQELRQLCIQEADLTGIIPIEMPLEPGEPPPLVRRRVGTAYQLPENLIHNVNNSNESIADLEIQIQLHANMAEAALGLANENNTSKTVRRHHMAEYQKHKREYAALQEKLSGLKQQLQQEQQQQELQMQQLQQQQLQQQQQQQQRELQQEYQRQQQSIIHQQLQHPVQSPGHIISLQNIQQQPPQMILPQPQLRVSAEHKLKKKQLRAQEEDTISMANSVADPFSRSSDLRHSMRSIRHTLTGDVAIDQHYSASPQRSTRRNYQDVVDGVYRLSISGYNDYIQRSENRTNNNVPHYVPNTQPGTYAYHQPHLQHQYAQESSPHVLTLSQYHQQQVGSQSNMTGHPQYSPHSTYNFVQQHSPRLSQGSPHMHQSSPHLHQGSPHHHQGSPHMSHGSSISSQGSPHMQHVGQHFQYILSQSPNGQQYSAHVMSRAPLTSAYHNPSQTEHGKNISIQNPNIQNLPPHRQQSSPSSSSSQKSMYYPSHTVHGHPSYKQYSTQTEQYSTLNPHQLQPHQQYEHAGMTAGLGGWWKKTENGEVWCNNPEVTSQRDKRFGSLDRRRNKRFHKRISPSIDNKSATLASVPSHSEHIRTASIKSSTIMNRRSQDSRTLVRTQSLGSVGAQTVDSSVWPSDDNSSCESDNRSINGLNQGLRKPRQKEWLETSLDGPVSPTHSIISRSQSAVPPSILAPEEKYVVPSPPLQPITSPPPLVPHNTKPPLEIPAESNPSPRMTDANLEMFNNNIPKNCTVVQAGLCKPYHEETKPFEMSDYYKYSTKYKKSPVKKDLIENRILNQTPFQGTSIQKNLNEAFEGAASPKQQVLSPLNISSSLGKIDTSGSLNSSLDISQLTPNVAEHFSAEMNAWYQNQERNVENNNAPAEPVRPKTRSSATLV